MRTIIALIFFGALLGAAELEQITTTDGRRFIGYYDGEAQTMTIEGPPKAVIRLPRDQVVDRAPFVRAEEKDPIKRDEAALVRMEAERLAAIADATRLFKFAASRNGKEAETALVQASERMSLADELAKKMEPIQARVDAAKPKPVAPVIVNRATQMDALQVAMRKGDALRAEAARGEVLAFIAWANVAAAPVPVPDLGKDPRQSERDARDAAQRENYSRELLRRILLDAEAATTDAQFVTVANLIRSHFESEARIEAKRSRRDPPTAK